MDYHNNHLHEVNDFNFLNLAIKKPPVWWICGRNLATFFESENDKILFQRQLLIQLDFTCKIG